MKLEHATWQEIEIYLKPDPVTGASRGVLLPTGSTEQHGPMGLIGTDTLCATAIAEAAAERAEVCIAPPLGYSPAPFNMHFPGTVSVSLPVFSALLTEVVTSLLSHGFGFVYIVNGHGANIEPIEALAADYPDGRVQYRSWWALDGVNALRQSLYGAWEGMHATPSEIAITQAVHRVIEPGDAAVPPEKLSAEYIRKHSGDRHGPPNEHRAQFPDGRVGSHSALANAEDGKKLLNMAISALVADLERLHAYSGQ